MEPLHAALIYLGLGWSVVPVHVPVGDGCSCGNVECASPGKHPRVRWHEHADEVTNAEEILRWWRRWPDTNVGVLTGPVSGMAVLDVDPRNGGGETLEEIVAIEGDLPDTVETETGGGGRHLWFSIPVGSGISSAVIGPGLELKATGSLVVVPPSAHGSGRRYAWRAGREPWTRAVAALPRWLESAASGRSDGAAGRASPLRTEHEQIEFAELWAELGIALLPGDRYYRCPMHDDTHPSLHIDAEGCRWYCFGCRRGGGSGLLRRILGHAGEPRPMERITGQVGRRRPVALRGPCDVDVVGESRHQDELIETIGGVRPYGGVDVTAVAELVFDPLNPYDSDAVEVFIDERPIGYLRHDDAVAYRALIDESLDLHGFATCWAHLRGGWDRGHGDVGAIGVTLELPASDDL